MTVPTARPGVSIGAGRVLGTREGNIDRFLAIPYAAPPFGERRFAPPAPPEHWEGERDASAFGPTAPQTAYVGGIENHLGSVEIAGDDILTVNVWTPADREAGHPLPVLVFVHGGALSRGTPALGAYDGATFARHGIVYVSIAYRVGSEGFSVLDDAPLNLGLLDQIAALDWVRREIGAFGGDPQNVAAIHTTSPRWGTPQAGTRSRHCSRTLARPSCSIASLCSPARWQRCPPPRVAA